MGFASRRGRGLAFLKGRAIVRGMQTPTKVLQAMPQKAGKGKTTSRHEAIADGTGVAEPRALAMRYARAARESANGEWKVAVNITHAEHCDCLHVRPRHHLDVA